MRLSLTILVFMLSLLINCTVDINPMTVEVRQNDKLIENEIGNFDFGTIEYGKTSSAITFTIHNLGYNPLELTGNPSKIHKSDDRYNSFEIDQRSIITPISQDSSTSFSIIFKPKALGIISANILIPNSSAKFNPYVFTVTGISISFPEINVKQGSDSIKSGSGVYDFGALIYGSSSSAVEFTIENLGSENLKLSGSPFIQISGANIPDFNINQTTVSTPIEAGNVSKFTITFTPISTGSKTALVSIANNDADEAPYTFTIFGSCRFNKTEFDFNGDGFDDVVIGTDRCSIAYIFLGSRNPSSLIDASKLNVRLVGSTSNSFGISVSSAGDFNNDGYNDVIVGGGLDNQSGKNCAYIFFGSENPPSVIDAANADVKLIGENTTDYFSSCVNCAGDVNNDGYDDVIVGGYHADDGGKDAGNAYIFFGEKHPAKVITNPDVKIIGTNSHLFGISVSSAGDVNNDGYDDVVIGAKYDNLGGRVAGSAYIFYGEMNISPILYATTADVILVGCDEQDFFGYSVSNAGDVNGDGFDDVIVGAYYDEENGSRSGSAYIFFGRLQMPLIIDASNADVTLLGEYEICEFGISVSSAGDINRDGYDDVIIGANKCDGNGSNYGRSYIFYGSASIPRRIIASKAQVMMTGDNSFDNFGISVSGCLDVNADGYEDVVVGADGDDDGGEISGCSFIFYGGPTMSTSVKASEANLKFIGENEGNRFGCSVSGGK